MSTVEAVSLSGISMFLKDCSTIGDVMAKVAIQHNRLATHIVITNPLCGQLMDAGEDIELSRVNYTILDQDEEMDIESCKLNLLLHATHDPATCSMILDMLKTVSREHGAWFAAVVLSDLVRARKGEWKEAMQSFLRLGVDGSLALAEAAQDDRVDTIELILSCDLKQELNLGHALKVASSRGCANAVKVLLSVRVDVNYKDSYTRFVEKFDGIMGRYVESLSIVESTALIEASFRGQAEVVQILLSANAEVNSVSSGLPAIAHAAENGHAVIVEMLLSAAADINYCSGDFDDTALALATHSGNREIMNMLLSAGANFHPACQCLCKTPYIHRVSEYGSVEEVQRLLSAAIDVNTVNRRNFTPLMEASAHGQIEVVGALLAARADVNHDARRTALTEAARGGHAQVTNVLLTAGAHVNLGSSPPLVVAYVRGHVELVNLLATAKADVDYCSRVDDDYEMPLLVDASANGYTEMVKALLSAGAEVSEFTMRQTERNGFTGVKDILLAAIDECLAARQNSSEDAQESSQDEEDALRMKRMLKLLRMKRMLKNLRDAQSSEDEENTSANVARC